MCILIVNRTTKLSKEIIETSWTNNPDGAGLLYIDSKGNFQCYKTMGNRKEYIKKYNVARKETTLPIILHFRIATHGEVTTKNIHPFRVNSNLFFAHNGIIDIETTNKVSDTVAFNERILKNLPTNFLLNDATKELIENYIDHSKLVFMNKQGYVSILNEHLGNIDKKGNWFSNYSYTEHTFKKSAVTTNYDETLDYCLECRTYLQSTKEFERGFCNVCNEDFDLGM